jgi:hypothetical protein
MSHADMSQAIHVPANLSAHVGQDNCTNQEGTSMHTNMITTSSPQMLVCCVHASEQMMFMLCVACKTSLQQAEMAMHCNTESV